ncbi:MAG: N-acetylmuramoyl-L-alanine amidase [Clostridiales bacterium]|jgi:N-acetylmuramoyl-L-alanine amidase|nr:N-acetylmuramoyl-L-alanine amidase [Clostridiales bacterium]
MNNNRKKMRRRRPRFTKRFLVLVFTVVAGIFAYFVIGALALGENGENGGEDDPPYLPHIDIGLLRMDFDDAALTYIFYYENAELDMARHHIIDNDNLVNFVTHNPVQGSMSVFTDAPAIFLTEYGYYTRNVYITAINPRHVYDRILILDPGHGGADEGATVGGIRESDITLAVSLYLYELFLNSGSGIKVYMTRTDDSFVHNTQRAHTANTVGDMLLSVHTNAYPQSAFVAGTETLFNDYSPMYHDGNLGRFDLQNSTFSQIIQNHLVAELDTRDRGLVERRDLLLLNVSSVPTAYVEIDFKTNPQALENLADSQYQQRIAGALYRGIIDAFEEAERGAGQTQGNLNTFYTPHGAILTVYHKYAPLAKPIILL